MSRGGCTDKSPLHPEPCAPQLKLACDQVHVTRNYMLQRTTNLTRWTNAPTFLCVTNH
jgi:hypothetical protein